MKHVFTWGLAAATVVASVFSVLDGDLALAAFGLSAASLMVFPAVLQRSPSRAAPPEAALLAASPFLVEMVLPWLPGRFFSYFAAAGMAVMVAAELEEYTEASFSHSFAILFVATVTIASSGFWAVTRFASDSLLGTALMPGHDPLMWEFVLASASGVAAGGFFDGYFRRWKHGEK